MKLYIAILDKFPDYMAPTLVAHSVLAAHEKFKDDQSYQKWYKESFKKCVLRVNEKEFLKISQLPNVHLGYELKTLDGKNSCAVVCPIEGEIPNVLKWGKLWKPSETHELEKMINYKYESFDDWFGKMGILSFRSEQFSNDFEIFNENKKQEMIRWLRATWDAARELKDQK